MEDQKGIKSSGISPNNTNLVSLLHTSKTGITTKVEKEGRGCCTSFVPPCNQKVGRKQKGNRADVA
eukprot:15277975-Ditylum_brightwellii.AAC.1